MTVVTQMTDWREAVQSRLSTYFSGASVDAEVVGGRRPRDGESIAVSKRRKTLACVFTPQSSFQEITRDVSLAQPTLIVRVFPGRSELPQSTSPDDPTPLEEALGHLLVCFDRTTQGAGYFIDNLSCRLTGVVSYDRPDQWYVEGTLQAYTLRSAA